MRYCEPCCETRAALEPVFLRSVLLHSVMIVSSQSEAGAEKHRFFLAHLVTFVLDRYGVTAVCWIQVVLLFVPSPALYHCMSLLIAHAESFLVTTTQLSQARCCRSTSVELRHSRK